jgi:16S rRNA (guanine1516-N2)-methyltransferase
MIAKAVGIQPGIRPFVLDATAGLGRDAFVLATLGCEMVLCERQPIIAASTWRQRAFTIFPCRSFSWKR